MAEKLWKQNGPQSLTLTVVSEWSKVTKAAKQDDVLKSALSAAGDRQAKMMKQIGEKLWKQYGPQGTVQTVLASWQQAREMSKVDAMMARLNNDADDKQRSLRKKAVEILWKMYGPQKTRQVALSVWKEALDIARYLWIHPCPYLT